MAEVHNWLLPTAVDLWIAPVQSTSGQIAERGVHWGVGSTKLIVLAQRGVLKPADAGVWRDGLKNCDCIAALPFVHSDIRHWAAWNFFLAWLLCQSVLNFCPFLSLLGRTYKCWQSQYLLVFYKGLVTVCTVPPGRDSSAGGRSEPSVGLEKGHRGSFSKDI